jgi:vacuolar protein sorting-associated protein 35
MPSHPGLGSRTYTGGHGNRNGGGALGYDLEEMAEEQGWIARMVHLFRSDDLAVQLDLLTTAHRAFADGGDRVRWTFPPLVAAAVQLARRYRWREHAVADYAAEIAKIFRLIYRWTNDLYARVEASDVCLRLNLLALQAADDAALEDFAYEFVTAAFTVYEESISESKAQLQAVTLIIGTLQHCRVFSEDNYDKIVTKAAVTGAKLLKKGHQATAVGYASHLWWQTDLPGAAKSTAAAAGGDAPAPWVCRDGKRVLECLQKTLRIATSCIDELTTMEIYVDALEHYLYFFDRRVPEVRPSLSPLLGRPG